MQRHESIPSTVAANYQSVASQPPFSHLLLNKPQEKRCSTHKRPQKTKKPLKPRTHGLHFRSPSARKLSQLMHKYPTSSMRDSLHVHGNQTRVLLNAQSTPLTPLMVCDDNVQPITHIAHVHAKAQLSGTPRTKPFLDFVLRAVFLPPYMPLLMSCSSSPLRGLR